MRYVKLYKEGVLLTRARRLKELLNPCRLCQRECNALWLEGEIGECGAGEYVDISGMGPILVKNLPW